MRKILVFILCIAMIGVLPSFALEPVDSEEKVVQAEPTEPTEPTAEVEQLSQEEQVVSLETIEPITTSSAVIEIKYDASQTFKFRISRGSVKTESLYFTNNSEVAVVLDNINVRLSEGWTRGVYSDDYTLKQTASSISGEVGLDFDSVGRVVEPGETIIINVLMKLPRLSRGSYTIIEGVDYAVSVLDTEVEQLTEEIKEEITEEITEEIKGVE